MNYSAYENINSKLYIAYSEVARESKVADEIRQQTLLGLGNNFSNNPIANIKVALISSGKVIDTEVLAKYCHSCKLYVGT